jgi:hypothetical protein
MSSDNFPGYDLLTGFFERYFDGLRNVGGAWNDAWKNATQQPDYSFRAWSRDMSGIWSRTFAAAQRLYRYPLEPDQAERPVWVSIVADKSSSTADSQDVRLSRPLDANRKIEATNLERLGEPADMIPGKAVSVTIGDQRDTIRVSFALGKDNDLYQAGTYVGFIKLAGGAGPPIAIVFFSNNKPSSESGKKGRT